MIPLLRVNKPKGYSVKTVLLLHNTSFLGSCEFIVSCFIKSLHHFFYTEMDFRQNDTRSAFYSANSSNMKAFFPSCMNSF